MNPYAKKFIRLFVILLLVALAAVGAYDHIFPRGSSVTVKAPGPLPTGHLAPSEQFLVDYANYKKLDAEVRKMQEDSGLVEKQRLLQGTIDALNSQIPTGYTWDEATTSFKPRQLQAVPPPAPATPPKP